MQATVRPFQTKSGKHYGPQTPCIYGTVLPDAQTRRPAFAGRNHADRAKEWMTREYGQPTDRGYQWKEVFLPHGSRLRIMHHGHSYRAQVEGDLLMADGKITTPNAWVAEVCGVVRNAWRDIYVRRSHTEGWTHASDLRAGAARHPLINRRQRA